MRTIQTSTLQILVDLFLLRNFSGHFVTFYPSFYGKQIATFLICILQVRGGMKMNFQNIKLRVLVLLFLPLIFESSLIVLVSMLWYDQMTLAIAYTFAFTMAPVSTSMIMPTMLAMFDGHYGTHKKLP